MFRSILILLAMTVAFSAPANAQSDYPTQPIRLILPFPPGGGTDTLARILGEAVGENIGQQIVVDNRPGAAGNIASEAVYQAEPDGYTLLMGFSTALTVNPLIYDDLNFDIQEDFDPVVLLAEAQYFLVTNPSVPATTIEELVAYAKGHPGELNFSSSGVGGPLHLSGELFAQRSDIDIVHVPYGGGGPAAQAVLSGEVDMLFGSAAATVQHAEEGSLNMLGTTALERSDLVPDVPTLDESGLDGFKVTSWYGLLAPAGTPQEVIDKLHTEFSAMLEQPGVQEALANSGLTPIGGDAEELAELIRAETEMWAPVVEAADIQPGAE